MKTRAKKLCNVGDQGRRGSTLVVVVSLIVMLMAMGLAFVDLATRHSKSAQAHFSDRRAFYLADAGINEAVSVVRLGGLGSLGNINTPVRMGGGLFWVEVTDLGGGQLRLVSTALVESGRATIEVVIDSSFGLDAPLFDNVLNSSKAPLTLSSNVLVDSFDSMLGTYASQVVNVYDGVSYAGANAWVRSAMDILVSTNARVFGDAIPGPGQAVVLAGASSYVSGSTAPAAQNFNFDPISPPAIASTGPYTAVSGTVTVMPAGQHGFDAFTIEDDAILRIEGPAEIVVTSFTGMKKGVLEIDARLGPVTFYCMGPYSQGGGFRSVPIADSPAAIAFMVDGVQDISFDPNAAVYGAYYVPEGNISFGSNCEFWGAMAAASVTMESNMKFHFDESLMDYWISETGQGDGEKKLLAWYESEIPGTLAADRSDPYDALGLTEADILTISDARTLSLSGTKY